MENRKLTKLEIFLIIVILALLIVIHKQVVEPKESITYKNIPHAEIDLQDNIEIDKDE